MKGGRLWLWSIFGTRKHLLFIVILLVRSRWEKTRHLPSLCTRCPGTSVPHRNYLICDKLLSNCFFFITLSCETLDVSRVTIFRGNYTFRPLLQTAIVCFTLFQDSLHGNWCCLLMGKEFGLGFLERIVIRSSFFLMNGTELLELLRIFMHIGFILFLIRREESILVLFHRGILSRNFLGLPSWHLKVPGQKTRKSLVIVVTDAKTYSKLQEIQMGKIEISRLAAIASLTKRALIIFSSSESSLGQLLQRTKSSGLASSSSSKSAS